MNSTSNDILPEAYKMTELGVLPEEWEVINLDKIIDLKRGISWRKDEANKEGIGIPVIGIPNIKENGKIDFKDTYFLTKNISSDKMVRINDILFVGSSGSIKNIGRNVLIKEIQQNKFTYASFTFLGRVNPLNANTVYIFYLLNSSFVDYGRYTRRASDGKYNFQLTQFKNEQKIPLPPLPEQQKIAAVLSAVQEAKEKTEAVIAATKALKKSMMKHLFTYGPVSPEETETVSLKETEIGPVPEDWEVVKLGEVAETYSGGTPSREQKKYFKGKIGWLKSGELNDNNIYLTQEYITEEALKKSSAKYVENNTLLIAMYGATVGKVGLAKAKFTINQAICAVNLNEKLWPEFYFFYFQMIRNKLLSMRFGGAQPNVNQQIIKQISLPLPPLPIQQKIASILSAIDAKIEAEENKKKALEELFKSLLHNLMTGKIRVNNLKLNEKDI
jgi:type I restriction enzyme S subunit